MGGMGKIKDKEFSKALRYPYLNLKGEQDKWKGFGDSKKQNKAKVAQSLAQSETLFQSLLQKAFNAELVP